MSAKNSPVKKSKKEPRMRISPKKSAAIAKDILAVLKGHGLPAGTHLAFTTSAKAACKCSDGRSGVLRNVGGMLVCDCD